MKFRKGDRVRHKSNSLFTRTGIVREVYPSMTIVKWPDSQELWCHVEGQLKRVPKRKYKKTTPTPDAKE